MTEAEWLSATDPRPLIGYVRSKLSDRKARLFAVATARVVSHLFSGPDTLRGVEIAELFADGLASDDERATAWGLITKDYDPLNQKRDAVWAADSAAESALVGAYRPGNWYKAAAEVSRNALLAAPECLSFQLGAFHCIFGNPFRPVAFDPAWRTSAAVALASQMYEGREFGPMPILADALQEAGCDHADILAHCRGPGPHVRGCWVVDLVLGKS